MSTQRRQSRGVERIEVRENISWSTDGPFGIRRIRAEQLITGDLVTGRWDRHILWAEVDGRRIATDRWEQLERRRRALMGPQVEEAVRAFLHMPWMIRHLRPVGTVTEDVVDGARYWRVDAVPQGAPAFVDRYTLWFDRDVDRIHRTRVVLRIPGTDVPVIILTDYVRLDGLDVPRRRRIEGTSVMKRRLRTFTVLFEYDAVFSDYRIVGSDS